MQEMCNKYSFSKILWFSTYNYMDLMFKKNKLNKFINYAEKRINKTVYHSKNLKMQY